jgi:hypothetical protein
LPETKERPGRYNGIEPPKNVVIDQLSALLAKCSLLGKTV